MGRHQLGERPPWLRVGLIAGLIILVLAAGWLFWSQGSGDSAIPTGASTVATSQPSLDPMSGLAWVDLSSLPAQARQTVGRIEAGGPYPYARDGIVFDNRERLLPPEPTGWYHEYTVPTPGSADRGARRIVTGGRTSSSAASGVTFYYSDDHYASFRRIRVEP